MDHHKLVRDCLNGRREAQYALYEEFSQSMLAVCYRYTKSMDDAEDVLQEGFIKVFKNLQQFKFEGELGGWVRRIILRYYAKPFRKRRSGHLASFHAAKVFTPANSHRKR